ncbi:MAG: carboxypeptidase regulatory-like domain-containing protein, partial [Longimicrobiales bacterium]
GVLTGTVSDDLGGPLNDVTITLTNRTTGQSLIRQSTRSGVYTSGFVAPGVYDALFERLGFQPERWESIVVGPGERVALDVRLEEATGPVDSANVYLAPARRVGGAARWLIGRFPALPLETGDLSTLAALSSRAGPLLEVEGLPAAAHAFIVDGVPLMDRPGRLARSAALSALGLTSLGFAKLDVEGLDPELPGASGAHFSGLTVRGSRQVGVYAYGDYAGDALAAAENAAPFQSYRAGGQLSGAIVGDTAQFIIGGEYQRSERPFESVWAPDALVEQLESTAAQLGANLTPWTEPVALLADRISAFGRLDLRLGDDNTLNAQARFATLPTLEMIAPRTGQLLTVGAAPDAREVLASATLTSSLSEQTTLETTLGFENGRLQRAQADAELPAATEIISAGRRFGVDDPLRADADLLQAYGRLTLHLDRDEHRFKAGLWGSFRTYDLEWTDGRASRFTFASPAHLAAMTGAFRTTTGVASRSDFDARRWAVFAQDTWTPRTGLEVVAGARLSVYQFT